MNRLLASALFAALASVAAAQTINFEELGAQPSAFSSANPLGNEYGPAVLFSGPSALNGGAILNQSGNFGVNAYSGEHFLAFNRIASLMNGGTPTDPETVSFSSPMTNVSIWAAGGFNADSFLMQAYNAANVLVDSDSANGQNWVQLSVSGAGITKVVLTQTGDNAWVYDDLTYVPEPHSLVLLLIGAGMALRVRR